MNHPLQEVRDLYLATFLQSLKDVRTRFDRCTTELLLDLPHLTYPEQCHRLYRADIVGTRDGENGIVEVHVKAENARPWQDALPSTARIDTPLVWNGIEFRVHEGVPDEQELVAWSMRWLDVGHTRLNKSRQFQEVVHSITPPRLTIDGYDFSVDFGSAPTTAFDELLELLVREEAQVSIGSFTYVGAMR